MVFHVFFRKRTDFYLCSFLSFKPYDRREKNKGIGVELAHSVGDGLFQAGGL
jgi:hypothetical protein